jgi:hypothetical protein
MQEKPTAIVGSPMKASRSAAARALLVLTVTLCHQRDGSSAMMRSSLCRPIQLMVGLLSAQYQTAPVACAKAQALPRSASDRRTRGRRGAPAAAQPQAGTRHSPDPQPGPPDQGLQRSESRPSAHLAPGGCQESDHRGVIRSPAGLRGRFRITSHMRRSRATSRSCSLCRKQLSIHLLWDGGPAPRPAPANVRPRVSIARTLVMNSARSCANTADSRGSSSVATTPGSQVCTDHGSG